MAVRGRGLSADMGSRLIDWLPWVAWSAVLVVIAASAVGLSDSDVVEGLGVVGTVVGTLAVATIGALAVARGQARRQGWMLLGFALSFSIGVYCHHLLEVIASGDPENLSAARLAIAIGDCAYTLALWGLIILLFLMPDGRLLSPRWKPVVWAFGLVAGVTLVQSILVAATVDDLDAWIARSTLTSIDGASLSPFLLTFTIATIATSTILLLFLPLELLARWRSASNAERQQLKWILVGAGSVLLWFVLWLPQPDGAFGRAFQSLLPGLALTTLGVTFGLALFKYRLWDVDVVIRRSLVYGTLWLGIAAAYVGVASGLGLIAGSRFSVEIAIGLTVLATLLFQPARSRLERLADTLVFGPKDSPASAIQTFGRSVGVESAPKDIAGSLAEVVKSVLGAEAVNVEIDGTIHARSGVWDEGATTRVPIGWGDEEYGSVSCLAIRGEEFDEGELAVVRALATQAALTISHQRLASRMISMQESERKRIERDIHDGVQQDLATQLGQLALARSQVADDPVLSEQLSRIQSEMQRTLVEIRELAQGIHPSVLRDGGLLAAVEDRCGRLPLKVSIESDPELRGTRLDSGVEAAAYFTVAEAVANVVKHSNASSVSVGIGLENGDLRLSVVDDGDGFDPNRLSPGTGISGLSDRVRALGGELAVKSSIGAGTTVEASLPIDRKGLAG